MEISICAQLLLLAVCAALTYFSLRKVKNEETQNSGFRKYFSQIEFWLCVRRRKRIYEYLREEKFDKLLKIDKAKYKDEMKKILNDKDILDSSLFYGTDQKGNSFFIKHVSKGNEKELLLVLNFSDGRTYELPDHPSTKTLKFDKQSWSIGGLKISVLEPLKRFRITFNGLLRNGIRHKISDGMGEIEHVRFNFIFIANSAPLMNTDFWRNDLNKGLSTKWLGKIKSEEASGFDQWGSLIGQAIFEDSSTKEFYLRGVRQKEWKSEIISNCDRIICFFGSIKGLTFHFNIRELKDCSQIVKFGHLKLVDGSIHAVDWLNFNAEVFVNPQEGNSEIIQFKAGENKFEFSSKFQKDSRRILHQGENLDEEYLTYEVKLQKNKNEGTALVVIWTPQKRNFSKQNSSELSNSLRPNLMKVSTNFVLSFREETCQNEELVGGKGSSLALLTSIETNEFSVPQGFCITAPALKYQIDSCENLSQAIDDLEKLHINQKTEVLKNYCERIVSLLESTSIIAPVRETILKALKDLEEDEKLKNSKENSVRFAVRSSAVGEDSEETSAAGQNSTFLGIQGAENILKYVAHCWASLYTYQSVEYRRRQGLPIKASMGVCVQKMVNAEVAGVMFTRHPTTGDPRKILITSNYGLGETVVSAMVEPDTIIFERDWNDTLTIKSIAVGKRFQKITMTENSGTGLIELTEEEINKSSLSNQIALNLAKVGIQLENIFQSSRDIEWAIVGDKIFLLQSRPITSLDNWTDFELTHELDSIVPVENDILTFANVGEVLPGVLSTLTLSTFVVYLNGVVNGNFNKPSIIPYIEHNIHISSMRITLNYMNTMLAKIEKELPITVKIIDVAVCGHEITTPELYEQARERNGTNNFIESFLFKLDMAFDIWNGDKKLQEIFQVFKNIKLDPTEFDRPLNIYQAIENSMDQLEEITDCHNIISRISVFWEIFLISVLTENSGDLTAEHYSDIAVLLSSCSDVISAEVPIALRKIAKFIKDTGRGEEFSQIDAGNVAEWLKENCTKAADLLEKFLKHHGHRSIKEMDFISETWSMKPEKLFSAIQAMVKCAAETTQIVDLSPEETVAKLKTPKKKITRWILEKFVMRSRKAVARREKSKSVLTHAIHKFRLCYRKLANLLVAENRLPEKNLLFFLTHHEIGLLIEKRDLSLVRKSFNAEEKTMYPMHGTKFYFCIICVIK
ncbi:putative phosphoenolpyruvate synthase isoform X2 [Belonocnema kinseyi]|uniref:putative phosphoenolpyruvate synthase isoform X2 n=1 Tax=Belonocnema kinseyi TaxID=2817044 RepID=UPI00143CD5B5|nr:putative phosphoenolpyruvate synthase isoform X2 [Belonocnema kinseyi]